MQAGLQAMADLQADVRLWTTEFGLSATYIETLERVAAETDFAVTVFSGDDRVTSRSRRQLAPRDNVIFELGLFIGALGRPRCFLVHRKGVDLKLPSDLLAVVSADYSQAAGQPLADALHSRCAQIATRVRELGLLRRISPAAMVRRQQSFALAALVGGDWWERIRGPGASVLSLLRIEYDEASEALVLRGQAYDTSGQTAAHWAGFVVELVADKRSLVYRWTGTHPNAPNTHFHGIGEIEFDSPTTPTEPAISAWGRFWDVDEARPQKTTSKAIELRRESDADVVTRMRNGRSAERQALAVQIQAGW